jgi:hypothetical protein
MLLGIVRSSPDIGLFVPGMIEAYSEILPPQCNAPVMLLRRLGVIFVVTLCSGRSAYAIPASHRWGINEDGASMNKAQQGTDAFRGRGMAAKQTHWIVLACSEAQHR